jgi:hypothetical protein
MVGAQGVDDHQDQVLRPVDAATTNAHGANREPEASSREDPPEP